VQTSDLCIWYRARYDVIGPFAASSDGRSFVLHVEHLPLPTIVISINPLTKIPKVPMVIFLALAKSTGLVRVPGKLFGVY
jgi:hypothetical protein